MPPSQSGPAARVLVLDRTSELAARIRHNAVAAAGVVKACPDISRAEKQLASAHWDVLVAGPSLMHQAGLRRLASLHQRYPWLSLVLALHERPRADLVEIVQVGADDLVPLRADDDELRQALTRAVGITRGRLGMMADGPGGAGRGRVVMISSASGGCGKTFLATNAAEFLAHHTDRPVVLFDLDLQFGEVSTALRLRPDLTISDALAAEADGHRLEQILDEYLLPHPDGFKVLAAPRLPAEADSVTPPDIARVLDVLRSRGAWVVVDTHEGLSDLAVPVIEAVDHVFAVATPDRPSLVNLGRYLATLSRLGVETGRISVVLNKLESDCDFDTAEMAAELGRDFAAMIPYSRDVARSLNVGVPLIAGRPKSRIAALLTGALSSALPGSRTTQTTAPAPVSEPAPVQAAGAATDAPEETPSSPEASPGAPVEPTATDEGAPTDVVVETDLRQLPSRRCAHRQARPIRRCRPPADRAVGVPCVGRGPPAVCRASGPLAGLETRSTLASGGCGGADTAATSPPAAGASGH